MPRKREPTLLTETRRITRLMQDAGTYKPYFSEPIRHLAELYLDLRQADEEWREDGGTITVTMTTKGGEVTTMNPALSAKYKILDQCRLYEAKLGLTPADHRKLMADVRDKPESTLGAALRLISG